MALFVIQMSKTMPVRQFLQSDIGSLPNKEFLRSIELLGTRAKPLVDAELRAPTLQGQAA